MKTVLITGAGSGIGSATAQVFSENGWFCLLLGRDQSKLDSVRAGLNSPSKSFSLDLTEKSAGERIVKMLSDEGIKELHSLVNNAGIFSRASLSEIQDDEWTRMFETNLFGPARVTAALLPFLCTGANIVNVSSTLGNRPTSDTGVYSASKAAMNNWTKSLALDLAANKIRVNAVCPGIVDTPIHDFNKLEPSEKAQALEAMAGLQPLGRIGKPHDVARAIYFLASEASQWTTGALLDVDGGINL